MSRPRLREHYATFGPDGHGPADLLALVIGTGSAGSSARTIATRLLDAFGSLASLRDAPVHALAQVSGVGPARAVRIHAALHLAVRAHQPTQPGRVDHPQALMALLAPRLQVQPVETFWVVGLDARLGVRLCRAISRGSRRCTVVDPAEVFRTAIASGVAAVAVAHNHPSGDPAPSSEDHTLTRRLVQAGQLLGIPVLDHIIIGGDRYWSFAEEGALPQHADFRTFTGAATPNLRWSAPRPASPC